MDAISNFNQILSDFHIKATCLDSKVVDNYIFYDLKLHPSTKVKSIQKYSDEISLALKTPCKPSVKILHELGLVRLEFISPITKTINLLEFFPEKPPAGGLISLLGQTVDGKKVWMDLANNPHMIIAGTTGSGKSTLLHTIIANMLKYNEAIMYLIDPKKIEFYSYSELERDINISFTYNEAVNVLNNLISTMEERYKLIRMGYPADNLPYILLMIDEFADLIMQDKDDVFYNLLCRLAQKSRAAKISIILSTQRPSVNIINGTIKANFPARIACKTASHMDSKVILDCSGAENLLGQGDALIKDNTRYLERFQVAYTTAKEVCEYFKSITND
jgi:S-DNA-T family DNA segregation ATPase FtsK/SpoIIIE